MERCPVSQKGRRTMDPLQFVESPNDSRSTDRQYSYRLVAQWTRDDRFECDATTKWNRRSRRMKAVILIHIPVDCPLPRTVILSYSEGSTCCGEPARSFGVPQDDEQFRTTSCGVCIRIAVAQSGLRSIRPLPPRGPGVVHAASE